MRVESGRAGSGRVGSVGRCGWARAHRHPFARGRDSSGCGALSRHSFSSRGSVLCRCAIAPPDRPFLLRRRKTTRRDASATCSSALFTNIPSIGIPFRQTQHVHRENTQGKPSRAFPLRQPTRNSFRFVSFSFISI